MRIWVDAWQMQCCGDAFSPGSQVDWMAWAAVDEDFLSQFLPHSEVQEITHTEERHGDVDPGLVNVVGEVLAVRAVYCGYESSPSNNRALVPIPDSGVIEPRTSATGWEDESPHGKTFLGYIVDVASG